MPWNDLLRQELLALKEASDRIHAHLPAATLPESLSQSAIPYIAAHTDRLKAIVQEYGWPGIHVVGNDGALAAWVLLLRGYDIIFMQACLILMHRALHENDVEPGTVAFLEDRILVRTGKPQRYGSQYHRVDEEIIPYPIDDEAHVDERRATVGFMPLEVYLRHATEYSVN